MFKYRFMILLLENVYFINYDCFIFINNYQFFSEDSIYKLNTDIIISYF